mgnify:CR=1 FL=1
MIVDHFSLGRIPVLSQQNLNQERAVYFVWPFFKVLGERNKVTSVSKKPWHFNHFYTDLLKLPICSRVSILLNLCFDVFMSQCYVLALDNYGTEILR